MTYPLHVLVRFELEQALLEARLEPADLPCAFAEGLAQRLGVRPTTPRTGWMQDIHWFEGIVGYFPTYSLGAMAAAQLFQAALRDLPELPRQLANGELREVFGWLRERVHAKASSRSSDEILIEATGSPLGTKALLEHLTARYLADRP